MLMVADIVPSTLVEGPGNRMGIWVQGCAVRCPSCCNPGFLPTKTEISSCEDIFLDPSRSLAVRISECFEEGPRRFSSSQLNLLLEQAKEQYGIRGLTLLGGEPFAQATELQFVAGEAQKMGLSVMIFTGHPLTALSQFSGWKLPTENELNHEQGHRQQLQGCASFVSAETRSDLSAQSTDPFLPERERMLLERSERLVEALESASVRALLSACDILVDGPYLRSQHQEDRRWIGSKNQQMYALTQRGREDLVSLGAGIAELPGIAALVGDADAASKESDSSLAGFSSGADLSKNHAEIRLVNGVISINGFPLQELSWTR